MISLDTNSEVCLYEQLYQQLRDDIAFGRLPKGTRLKSLRELEQDLDVSRTTVSRAYQQLISEGYVRASQGSGYYVEDIGPTTYDGGQPPTSVPIAAEVDPELECDFSPNYIDSKLFPWKKWRKALNAAIDYDSFSFANHVSPSKGARRLRENLARFLYQHRGVHCSPEQIIVCTDAQRATDIVLSLLDPDKHRFAFEEPGVVSMRSLICNRGFEVHSIPAIGEYSLPLLKVIDCNVVFTMPSCQLPLGSTMPLRDRNLLLRWATTHDAYLIEYDHHARFQGYGNSEIPSMQSLDKYHSVVYIGTLSEMLPSTMNLAYLVLPPALLEIYEERYRSMPPTLPMFYEHAFADILESGTLTQHIRKVEITNKSKLEAIAGYVEYYMPHGVKLVNGSLAGYAIIKIKGKYDREDLMKRLMKEGVRLHSVYHSCHEHCSSWDNLFVLGFGALDERKIEEGCKRIGKVLTTFLNHDSSASDSYSIEQFNEEFEQAIVRLEKDTAVQVVKRAIDEGAGTMHQIEDSLSEGIRIIGEMFDDGQIGICELMEATELFDATLTEFTTSMAQRNIQSSQSEKIVIYTVEGDLHDLGKNIVKALLRANNFEVYDLGCNASPEEVLAKAEEVDAPVILGSALMTTTMPAQKDLISLLEEEGVRDDYFVMFGGAPVTKEWVTSIGGDAYTDSAADAVSAVKEYVASKR